MKYNTHLALGLLSATLLAAVMSACAPVNSTLTASGPACDPVEAKAMVQKGHCTTCHGLARQKAGPTFKAVAERYQGNPNAEADLYAHLMTGDAATMSDGHTEYHKRIANENSEKVRNMVCWVLSQ